MEILYQPGQYTTCYLKRFGFDGFDDFGDFFVTRARKSRFYSAMHVMQSAVLLS